MNEPMWTLDVDYVMQNNRSLRLCTIVSNTVHVFYDCSE